MTVDDETQHTWHPVFVGRIRNDGQFDIVWSSEKPIRPIPYPPSRSREEWDSFLENLYQAWGGWANPGTAGLPAVAPAIPRELLTRRRADSLPLTGTTGHEFRELGCRITITTQLLLWFLIISLIPCAVLTAIISYQRRPIIEKNSAQGLLAIADAKAMQLENFIRERRADLNMVQPVTMSLIRCLASQRHVRKRLIDALCIY